MDTYLYNLFHTFDWYEILPYLLSDEFNAGELLDMYKSAYHEILTIPFTPNTHLTLIFELELELENTIVPMCMDIHGNTHTIPQSWSSWLSLSISSSLLKKYRSEYIVAMCLYTMTLSGFSQTEITESTQNLN